MHAKIPQEYKYPKNIQYGYGSIFWVPVLHYCKHAKQSNRLNSQILANLDTPLSKQMRGIAAPNIWIFDAKTKPVMWECRLMYHVPNQQINQSWIMNHESWFLPQEKFLSPPGGWSSLLTHTWLPVEAFHFLCLQLVTFCPQK